MSADNWAVCPGCKARDRKRAQEALAAAEALYGTVSREEYQEALDKVPYVQDDGFYRTFREDYWISGAETGTVTVSYGGSCSKCGLELSFKDEHPIPGVTA